MTLRARLVVALTGSGLAILLGCFVAREIAIRYASEASIQSSIEARLGSLEREACETGRDFERSEFRPHRPDKPGEPTFPRRGRGEPDFRRRPGPGGPPGDNFPGHFGGGQRMTRVFFYDPDFNPRHPGEPGFPEAAKARLRSGETFVNGRDEGGFFGAAATSWTGGPCTYALAIMPTPPPLRSRAHGRHRVPHGEQQDPRRRHPEGHHRHVFKRIDPGSGSKSRPLHIRAAGAELKGTPCRIFSSSELSASSER